MKKVGKQEPFTKGGEGVSFVSELSGVSLIHLLRDKLQVPGKAVKRAVESGACFINGRLEKFASYKVKRGERILFYIDRLEKREVTPLTLIYEDEFFKAWSKPSFYVCDETFSLHRLDKETSGIILTSNRKEFFDLFKRREIDKKYFAIVEGEVKEKSGEMKSALGVKKAYQGQKIMGEVEEGQFAHTKWKKLAFKDGLTLLECRPVTGRTHQIRVQLAAKGFPVLGDHQYGNRYRQGVKRMFLHAYKISFVHPFTKYKIGVKAPITQEFLEYFNENLFC